MSFALAACAGATPHDSTAPARLAGQELAEVLWVDDGDTIHVSVGDDSLTLRLIGVNAPEHDECFGDAARDYLIGEIDGTHIGITRYGTDQFGRTLADVWQGDVLLNISLVRIGMATALRSDRQYPNNQVMLAAENSAYEEGVGMWSPMACEASGDVPEIEFDLAQSQLNPDGPDDEVLDSEWIAIVNRGEETVDMSGWTLRDASSRNRLSFPGGVTLQPGQELRITSGCSSVPSWCGTTSIWNNDGDLALLLDHHGRVVARARY